MNEDELDHVKIVEYQQCSNCILDASDTRTIEFNADGVCNYCIGYSEEHARHKAYNEYELTKVVEEIKAAGSNKPYDCLLGISGGVDSTYLAVKAKDLGLRPLLVHFDNGWNSELAVDNIERTVSKLGFDLHTIVVKWEEFRDLQLAFLKAGVVDIEMITDHAIIATLYKLAVKFRIKYILSGTNLATEGILPSDWIHHKADHVHILAINQKFGGRQLKSYPLLRVRLRNRAQVMGLRTVSILNYIDYNKDLAKRELKERLGWRDYGGKHYESIFTRFYQGYILPRKFGIDKRKAHLSTLICSKQLTRQQALEEMKQPLYDKSTLQEDYEFVVKKLGLTKTEFEAILDEPPKPHADYPVETEIYDRMPIFKLVRPIWRFFKKKYLAGN